MNDINDNNEYNNKTNIIILIIIIILIQLTDRINVGLLLYFCQLLKINENREEGIEFANFVTSFYKANGVRSINKSVRYSSTIMISIRIKL